MGSNCSASGNDHPFVVNLTFVDRCPEGKAICIDLGQNRTLYSAKGFQPCAPRRARPLMKLH